MTSLARQLAEIAGSAHVLTDPGQLAGYVTDWTGRYQGQAACVVRPGSAAEAAAVLRCCAALGVPLIPQGGNTGLVGGSVPAPAGLGSPGPAPVVLSTRRLTALGPVDAVAGQVTAAAGVTIAALRSQAGQAGFEYGVDLAARDSATVGGTIATNAGGIRAIRYGRTRSQLLGLTAVLADGSVLDDLAGLPAGTAGYDLSQLLAGSEGTLAVIMAARLRLWPAEPAAAVLLAGVRGAAEAAELQAEIGAAGPWLARRRVRRGGRPGPGPAARGPARAAGPPAAGLPAGGDSRRRRHRAARGAAAPGYGGRAGRSGPGRAVGLP